MHSYQKETREGRKIARQWKKKARKKGFFVCILYWQTVKEKKNVLIAEKNIGFGKTIRETLLEMCCGISRFYMLILHFVQIISLCHKHHSEDSKQSIAEILSL